MIYVPFIKSITPIFKERIFDINRLICHKLTDCFLLSRHLLSEGTANLHICFREHHNLVKHHFKCLLVFIYLCGH